VRLLQQKGHLPYIEEPRMPLIVAVELLQIPIEDAESVI
jgi:hypothetical protein